MTYVLASNFMSTYCGVNACLAKCLYSVLNVKVVVATFNQEKALVWAFSVITNLRMELFEALVCVECVGAPVTGAGLQPTLAPWSRWGGHSRHSGLSSAKYLTVSSHSSILCPDMLPRFDNGERC